MTVLNILRIVKQLTMLNIEDNKLLALQQKNGIAVQNAKPFLLLTLF